MFVKIKLADMLESKGLSNRKFAEITGIRHPSINDYCNNDTIHLPLDNLAKMCLVLNCQISDIIELVPEPEKDPLYVLIGGMDDGDYDELNDNEILVRIKPQKTRKAIKPNK